MDPHRLGEQFAHTLFEPALRVGVVDIVGNVPVAGNAHLPVLDDQCMPWHQRLHILEECLLAKRILKRKVFAERVRISRYFRQHRQQRLDLRRKVQSAIGLGVIEGLDAEAVSRGKKAGPVPYGKRKHASQVRNAIRTPLGVRGQHDLRVGRGTERPAILKLLAQFGEIIDFAVVGDEGTVWSRHRLVARLRQINDR